MSTQSEAWPKVIRDPAPSFQYLTLPRALRGKVNSKRGPKSFYKGRGARSLGKVDSKGFVSCIFVFPNIQGHFHYQEKKLPVFHIPDLTNFPLKPYVALGTPMVKVPPPTVPELKLDDAEARI